MHHFLTRIAAIAALVMATQTVSGQTLPADTPGSSPMPANELTDTLAPSAQERAKSQILVRFSPDLTPVEIEAINTNLGAEVINVLSDGHLLLVEIAYPDIRPQIIDAYSTTDGVIYAEPNATVSIPETPEQMGITDGTTTPDAPLIGLPKISD